MSGAFYSFFQRKGESIKSYLLGKNGNSTGQWTLKSSANLLAFIYALSHFRRPFWIFIGKWTTPIWNSAFDLVMLKFNLWGKHLWIESAVTLNQFLWSKVKIKRPLLKILFSVYFLVLNFPVENNSPLKLIGIVMAYVKVGPFLKWSLSQQCLMHFAICVLIS